MKDEIKRLFFGLEVEAPWPVNLPAGRLLDEKHRHITLAFLGHTDFPKLNTALEHLPLPDFKVGFSGKFTRSLFLPPKHPHVVAWEVDWMDSAENDQMRAFQRTFIDWLKSETFQPDERPEWLPHVTLARSPFVLSDWKKVFVELPFIVKNLHLYESVGNLQYEPRWTHAFVPPFEEIEHTADIAFKVRGENIRQLFKNAFIAMTFHYPSALKYYALPNQLTSLDDLIMGLNSLVTKIDGDIGIPLKAVSYHGEIIHDSSSVLEWEMIIDV